MKAVRFSGSTTKHAEPAKLINSAYSAYFAVLKTHFNRLTFQNTEAAPRPVGRVFGQSTHRTDSTIELALARPGQAAHR